MKGAKWNLPRTIYKNFTTRIRISGVDAHGITQRPNGVNGKGMKTWDRKLIKNQGFPRFPKVSQGFPRFPKVSQGFPRFPKVSLPKLTKVFLIRLEILQRRTWSEVSYPLEYIPNVKIPAVGGHPKNIIMLSGA